MIKKSLIVSSIIIGLSCYLIYQKMHTNNPDEIKDYTGKYILNPDYKEFHKYEWTDLKTVYPTKLAYDPAWFKLPPDKYIPKEQPIPKNITSISDPIIRRQAYFQFLCNSESVIYKKSINYVNDGGLLDLAAFNFFPKINNYNKNSHALLEYETNSNPFIYPIYSKSFKKIIDNDIYNFYYENITDNAHSNWNSNHNSFKEIMSSNGSIYEIRYDKNNSLFLPLKKVEKSSAKFYSLQRYIERDNIKNLGIYGVEGIVFDRENHHIVNYYKLFYIGSVLNWKTEHSISNFSWSKISSCGTKANIIDKI